MTTIHDVVVIGGGVVGSATAYALAQAGVDVILLEQFELNHKRGSSHGDGRVVRLNYPESIYVEMSRLSYEGWDELSAASGTPLVHKAGLLETGPADCETLLELARALEEMNVPFEWLSPSEASQRFPQITIPDDYVTTLQADGGVVYADKAIRAFWEQAARLGAETRPGTKVAHVDTSPSLVTITTVDGNMIQAKRVVITVGGWAKKMLQQVGLDLPLKVTQEVLAYFAPRDASLDHSQHVMPCVLDYTNPENDFYSLPMIDVPGMKTGWHQTGNEYDPDTVQEPPPHIVEGMQDWARQRFPHVDPNPIHTVTCIYTQSPDDHFIMDVHPSLPNVVIGTGFSGHGFKFGPVLGQILAALALETTPPVNLETFNIRRLENPDDLERRKHI